MTFLIQQTLIYAVPLMIVALAGVFAERSGIINLALEGIMIFGAFAGVLFVNVTQKAGIFSEAKAAGDWVALQGFMLLAMLVAAILGAVFSLLLSFASVNLKADQTIGGTALNLMAPPAGRRSSNCPAWCFRSLQTEDHPVRCPAHTEPRSSAHNSRS